nr:hypothetical protein [Streptomyces sp. SID11385]
MHTERPAAGNGQRSRATLLHGSYGHGEALAAALPAYAPHGSSWLARIDPYGDTLFNEQTAGIAHGEALALLAHCAEVRGRAALSDLAELLARCARTPGSWVWCMGD